MSFKLGLLKEAQESDFENILHITINHAVLLFKNKSKSVHYKSILEWFYIASYILKNIQNLIPLKWIRLDELLDKPEKII